MIETTRFLVTLPSARTDAARGILERHRLLSKAGAVSPRLSPGTSNFNLTLRTTEARTAVVIAELDALGASVSAMERTRKYTTKELEAAPFLHATASTGFLTGPANLGSKWERTAACPECGAGGRPVAPLLIRAAEMGRAQVRGTNYGLFVVRAGIAQAMLDAGLTGVDVLPVRSPRKHREDAHLRWLQVTADWPLELPEEGPFGTTERCTACGYRIVSRLERRDADPLRYEAPVPGQAADLNRTKEGFGSRHASELIVSQCAFAMLRDLGVRDLRFEPVVFAPSR